MTEIERLRAALADAETRASAYRAAWLALWRRYVVVWPPR